MSPLCGDRRSQMKIWLSGGASVVGSTRPGPEALPHRGPCPGATQASLVDPPRAAPPPGPAQREWPWAHTLLTSAREGRRDATERCVLCGSVNLQGHNSKLGATTMYYGCCRYHTLANARPVRKREQRSWIRFHWHWFGESRGRKASPDRPT